MKHFVLKLFLTGFCLSLASSVLSQTVTTQKAVYAPNEKIVVNYYGFPGNQKDWIGVVPASYTVKRCADGVILLQARDDTVGYPEPVEG